MLVYHTFVYYCIEYLCFIFDSNACCISVSLSAFLPINYYYYYYYYYSWTYSFIFRYGIWKEKPFLFFFYQYTALSSRSVGGHQMYIGGSVVGKASTIGTEILLTPPLIFTGVKKCIPFVSRAPTPKIVRRKRAKSSITQQMIIRFRSNFVQSLDARHPKCCER